MSFKILKFNCCGLDVHKTWIYACIGITYSNNRTEYKQARFSSFTKGLNELCDWLAKYNCSDVCMESTGKYWIPVLWTSSPQQLNFKILNDNKITSRFYSYKTDIDWSSGEIESTSEEISLRATVMRHSLMP